MRILVFLILAAYSVPATAAEISYSFFGATRSVECSGQCGSMDERAPYGGAGIQVSGSTGNLRGMIEAGGTYSGPYFMAGGGYRDGPFSLSVGPAMIVEQADYDLGSQYDEPSEWPMGYGGFVELRYSHFFVRYLRTKADYHFSDTRQIGTDNDGNPIYGDRKTAEPEVVSEYVWVGFTQPF